MQLLDTANAAVVKPAVTTALPLVPAQPAAKRKYGQHGIVAMMKKQQETATSAASASLLPQKVPGPAKSCNVGLREPDVAWREPDLDDSDEDECEGDDEADAEVDDEDEEEDEEDETEDDEEEDEDEDNAEKEGPAKKKSLNDVLSIKKNTLRLGTVDAGYLRSASITTMPCALILSTSSSQHTHAHARAHTHTHTHTHTSQKCTHTQAESIVLCSCLVSILMKFSQEIKSAHELRFVVLNCVLCGAGMRRTPWDTMMTSASPKKTWRMALTSWTPMERTHKRRRKTVRRSAGWQRVSLRMLSSLRPLASTQRFHSLLPLP
jgi:hypothetical protein